MRLTSSNSDRERIADLANVFALAVALDYLERAYVRDSITAQEYHHPCARLLGQYKTLVNLVGNWDLDAFLQEYRVRWTSFVSLIDSELTLRLTRSSTAPPPHTASASASPPPRSTAAPATDTTTTMAETGTQRAAEARLPITKTALPGTTPPRRQNPSPRPPRCVHTPRRDSRERGNPLLTHPRAPAQNFITFMDALKLRLRAKDQLHPLLTDLMQSYSRFCSLSASGAGAGADESNAPEWEGRPKMLQWLITLNRMRASEEISDEQSRQVSRPRSSGVLPPRLLRPS